MADTAAFRVTEPAGSTRMSASTISSRPPGSDMNAPLLDFGWRIWRKARRTLPCFCSASRKRGNSARIDSLFTSPAWMPASSGSAR